MFGEEKMRLALGKTASINLTPLPLGTQIVNGEHTFYGAGGEPSQRAAAVANDVLQSTFGKSVPAFASETERAAVGAEKVEAAAFKDDESGAIRVVYREVVIQFERRTTASTREKLLDKFGLEQRSRSGLAPDKIIAVDPSRRYVAERVVELANELTEAEEVTFAFPNFVSEFSRDAVPEPNPAQWHLETVNARLAWKTTLGSSSIT